MKKTALVLASSSPYRKQLLQKLKLPFTCGDPHIDESGISGETPQLKALRLCKLKALALTGTFPEHLIIASDQVATVDNKQLSKPGNRLNSINQLLAVSGKQVHFFTSIGVLNSGDRQFYSDMEHSVVHFKPLQRKQIEDYVELDRPYNCAGAFKSEGLGIILIDKICTEDPNALIGLPLIKLIKLLTKFNVTI